jgi:predicted adenylyl cyclase CyaB
MATNLELKARILSLVLGVEIVRARGARFREVLHQKDTYFHVPWGRLKLREFGGTEAELIYYNRKEVSSERWSRYTRMPLRAPGRMKLILAKILGVLTVVEKERRLFMHGSARIHLDEVAGLGTFVEFEIVGQSADDSYRILQELRSWFSITDDDVVLHSYSDLFLGKKNAGEY